jgi:hypothetical protein
MTLDELFDTFRDTAFRLEGLPAYNVPEEVEALEYYSTHGHAPEGFNDSWTTFVRDTTSKGSTIQRLRLLSNQLTNYEKFELTSYSGLKAGEDIRIAKRSEHPYKYDFWMFDKTWIVRMEYATDGTFINYKISEVTQAELSHINYWLAVFTSAECL